MSYQEKNITVSLTSAILVLGYYLTRLFQMNQNGPLDSTSVFSLWGVVIVITIIVNIVGTILTHIVSAIIEAIRTRSEDPHIEDIEDERDELIKLKGTRVAHFVFSFGALISMLTLVFGKPALVMFSLLIFFGTFAEIIADITRLVLYRRGV
ncbi:MAG: hypothetical protein ISR58_10595 [Anaerolineales bacterium]|nr:hypothetical protein [Chloroflexota bacterium]MBL6981623.1 hypothetical protein [Anaerolineales bacterium]